jgi:predicted Zn-dependent protease
MKQSIVSAIGMLCVLSWQVSFSQDFRIRLHQTQNSSGTVAVTQADIDAERRFGRRVAAHILGAQPLVDDDRLTRYVNLLGKSLVLYSSRNELEFYFGVLDSPAINAYSAPGGYVFVTRGAIAAAQDEAELAAVLAHEIAHVNAQHIVKELNIRGSQSTNIASFARILTVSSDTARAVIDQAVDQAMQLLFNNGYKVQDEFEADQRAVLLLAASGYDPSALLRFLTRANDASSTRAGEATATHPAIQDRIEKIKLLIEQENLAQDRFYRRVDRFRRYVIQE